MAKKIRHHCKYNDKLIKLTPEEHVLAHNIESTIFTPMYVTVKHKILKEIKILKKKHKYISAWRLKWLLNYYSNEAYKKYVETLLKGSKITAYIGRQNGKSIITLKYLLRHEYMYLKKKHRYLKAMKIKSMLKHIDKHF